MQIQVLVVQPLNTIKTHPFPSPLTIAIMPKNSSKDRIDWIDEEIIKLLNWMEDNLNVLHRPSRWSKLCKLEEFGQNENIAAERIKCRSGEETFYKLHNEFQNKTGVEVTEGDCDATVAGKWHPPPGPRLAVIDADKPRPQVC